MNGLTAREWNGDTHTECERACRTDTHTHTHWHTKGAGGCIDFNLYAVPQSSLSFRYRFIFQHFVDFFLRIFQEERKVQNFLSVYFSTERKPRPTGVMERSVFDGVRQQNKIAIPIELHTHYVLSTCWLVSLLWPTIIHSQKVKSIERISNKKEKRKRRRNEKKNVLYGAFTFSLSCVQYMFVWCWRCCYLLVVGLI